MLAVLFIAISALVYAGRQKEPSTEFRDYIDSETLHVNHGSASVYQTSKWSITFHHGTCFYALETNINPPCKNKMRADYDQLWDMISLSCRVISKQYREKGGSGIEAVTEEPWCLRKYIEESEQLKKLGGEE